MSFLKSVLPIASAVLPFIPGGVAAMPFVGAAGALLNGSGGGQSPLGGLLGAVGPAVASNALAKNNLGQAEAIMNAAFDKTNGARGTIIDDFMSRMKGMTDPSLAPQKPPQLDPSLFSGIHAPQMSGALGARPGMAPTPMQQQGGNSYAQALAMLKAMSAQQQPPTPAAPPPPTPPKPPVQQPAQQQQQPTPIQQQQLAMGQNPNMMGADEQGSYIVDGTGQKYYMPGGPGTPWVKGGMTAPPQPWSPAQAPAAPTQPTFGGFRQLAHAGQPPMRGALVDSPFAPAAVQ